MKMMKEHHMEANHKKTKKKMMSHTSQLNQNIPKSYQEHWFCKSKETSEMILATSLMLLMVTSATNPISLAVSLMAASILLTPYLYKTLNSSWIPLILILTFSSGMMTLFMYTASLAANETNKTKKKKYPLLLVMMAPPMILQKKTQTSMKSFSSYTTMMILASILMVTLVAMTTQAHNPNQTLSSSF